MNMRMPGINNFWKNHNKIWGWTWFLDNCQTPVLGLRLRVDFTFTLDNNGNDNNDNNDNDNNNPHLNFFKGTVLGVKEQGLGIKDKGQSRVNG